MAKNDKNQIVTGTADLSDKQREQVKAIQADGGIAEVTKCHRCGKFLIRDKSIEQEAGDLCAHFDEQGVTPEFLMAHRATMSAPAVPAGFIKVADLHRICEKHNIPVNRMVNAIGKDRGLTPPIEPRFTPIYVGNARYVDPWCASKEGLDMIKGTKITKSEKAKAELAELEEMLLDVASGQA